MIAKTYSVALNGLQSSMVELEADIGNGLPILHLLAFRMLPFLKLASV